MKSALSSHSEASLFACIKWREIGWRENWVDQVSRRKIGMTACKIPDKAHFGRTMSHSALLVRVQCGLYGPQCNIFLF